MKVIITNNKIRHFADAYLWFQSIQPIKPSSSKYKRKKWWPLTLGSLFAMALALFINYVFINVSKMIMS